MINQRDIISLWINTSLVTDIIVDQLEKRPTDSTTSGKIL